ncbi:RICIN domain-containing protein [Umezawaea sp. NPDC059074]|uniref:RICIN domain-containing protein n=1 Tax=Umezawaea sp. NPDC059074 TaxID=3346716 RepID=UPI0036CC9FCB
MTGDSFWPPRVLRGLFVFRWGTVLLTAVASLVLVGAGVAAADAPPATAGLEPHVANAVKLEFDPVRDPAVAAAFGHIVNDNSGKCLAVPGGSTAAGTGLIQWTCGSFRDHQWGLEAWNVDGVRHYRVINLNSTQCLAVPGNSGEAGIQVIQWPCGTFPDHFWRVENWGGTSRFVNYGTGQCLAVPGASTAEGERVIQWPCGTFPDHFWR